MLMGKENLPRRLPVSLRLIQMSIQYAVMKRGKPSEDQIVGTTHGLSISPTVTIRSQLVRYGQSVRTPVPLHPVFYGYQCVYRLVDCGKTLANIPIRISQIYSKEERKMNCL